MAQVVELTTPKDGKKGMSIRKACKATGYTRSAFYRNLTDSDKRRSDMMLAEIIRGIQETPPVTFSYGIARVTAVVNRRLAEMPEETRAFILRGSERINHKRVARVMRDNGLNARSKRRWKSDLAYKNQNEAEERNAAQNILQRRFLDVKEPGKSLATDVTYLPLGGGKFLYLSALLDHATQEIVSFEISATNSVDMALRMLERARPRLAPGALIHSDQGAIYKSDAWVKASDPHGLRRSMSRVGNCWDNAAVENFFSRLKSDLRMTKNHRPKDRTADDLRRTVEEYIRWYNNERIQKRLGFMSPVAYRKKLEADKAGSRSPAEAGTAPVATTDHIC